MLMKKRTIGTVAYLGGLSTTLEAFTWAWGQLVQFNSEYLCDPFKGEIVHYSKATMTLHDFARNSLVTAMQGEWLLQLDTDHAPEPDLCARMVWAMQKYNLQVVSALYRHKIGAGSPVIYNWDKSGKFAMPISDWDRDVSALQIGTAGGGCLLVRRSVFDRIRIELNESPFTRFEAYGEDHAFFQRCRKLNIPVYALPHVESPHLVVKPLLMADYQVQTGLPMDRQDAEGFL